MPLGPTREEGYRFECQTACIKCCQQPGFVYLTEDDLARIAAFLGMSAEDFERKHCYRTKNFIRLRIPRLAPCMFLTPQGCSIHAVKPTQCSTFPFWPELLEPHRAWRQMAKLCPGMNQGPLVSIENAKAIAASARAANPQYYKKLEDS